MIGIVDIGISYGDVVIDNLRRAQTFDRPEDFIRDKIGFTELRRKQPETETSDLCVAAFENLCERTPIDPESVECVVVVTQNPDGHGLPHTSSIVQGKLGLHGAAAFDVSLGCSGYVHGLSILNAFMQANGMRCGLLFTADPYSKVLDSEDVVTELLFGDGATCTLIGTDPLYQLGHCLFENDGTKHQLLSVEKTGRLQMDGRSIFNFSLGTVPRQIKKCLEQNQLTPADVDLFVLHQASRYIVENMAKRLGVPAEKVPFALARIGNTVSSTIPMTLQPRLQEKQRTILISGFGVGLSWGTTVLKRCSA